MVGGKGIQLLCEREEEVKYFKIIIIINPLGFKTAKNSVSSS